ncbi:hypothetical protein [Stappia stellulata]|uniref:hypothetical protein n=1 Tax=Stappia stellulata TaxID=71235 RepID=UPI00040CFCA3|nr:hypothetical protein [Stappia stellulata]
MTEDTDTNRADAFADGLLHDLPLADIQARVNFPVFEPTQLVDWDITWTLRTEQPPGGRETGSGHRANWGTANPCSLRFEARRDETVFRLKQFLYDWGPAAGDLPCLWGSPATPIPLDGDYLGWHGRDFQGREGGYARLARTSCELAVISGELGEDGTAHVFRSLVRLGGPHSDARLTLPLARLSYWARHAPDPVNAPIGFLRWRRDRRPRKTIWKAADACDALDVAVHLPPDAGLALDSVIVFEYRTHREFEFVFDTGADKGHEVRIILFDRPDAYDRLRPWSLEKHPCHLETLSDGSLLAFVSDTHGAYTAIRNPDGSHPLLVLTSAREGWDRSWVAGLVAGIEASGLDVPGTHPGGLRAGGAHG